MQKSIIKAWQNRRGEHLEVGAQVFLSDRMVNLINDEVVTKVEAMLTYALVGKLIDDSLIPDTLILEKVKDPTFRTWELTGIVDGILEPKLLPLALKMDRLLREANKLLSLRRISAKRKVEWLDELSSITGTGSVPDYFASVRKEGV